MSSPVAPVERLRELDRLDEAERSAALADRKPSGPRDVRTVTGNGSSTVMSTP